jgi:hypothetical protein
MECRASVWIAAKFSSLVFDRAYRSMKEYQERSMSIEPGSDQVSWQLNYLFPQRAHVVSCSPIDALTGLAIAAAITRTSGMHVFCTAETLRD